MLSNWLLGLVPLVFLLMSPGAVAKPPAGAVPGTAVISGTVVPSGTAVISGTVVPVRTVDVPILMYHHIGNPYTYQTYSVDTAMFDWQMDYLEQNGYHTVGLDDIAAALTSGAPLPDKPIALTFDDGWVLQITNTLPSLLRHHFRGTYYIIVNSTGRHPGNMNWDQVRQLRDAGMWIGSHTLSHGRLPGMADTRLRAELVQSKLLLEQELSITVTSLAYPGGAFSPRVERLAQEAGYTTAVTVIKGYAQRADGLMRLQRVGVYGVDTQERFIAKVNETFFQKSWSYPHGQARLPSPTPMPTITPLPSLMP